METNYYKKSRYIHLFLFLKENSKKIKFIIFVLTCCFSFKLSAQVSIVSNYSCVIPGNTYPYTISGLTWSTSDKWCVTGGTINGSGNSCMNNQGSPTISVTWNQGISSGSVSYYQNGSNTPIATLNVNIATNTISPNFSPYNYNVVPLGKEVIVGFTGSDLSSCGTAIYSWSYSTDGTNYTIIPNSNLKDLTISQAFATTVYYKRTATIPSGTIVSPPMSIVPSNSVMAGVVSPSSVTVGVGTTLPSGSFTATAPTGTLSSCGGSYYSVQWQISNDNINWTTVGGGSGSGALIFSPPSPINTKTYIRQIVGCGQAIDKSNTIIVNVYTPLGGGIISPNSMIVSSGADPGMLTGSPASNGNISLGYTYTWLQSTDGGNTFNQVGNGGYLIHRVL